MGKSAPKPGIQHVLRRVANVVKGEESYAGEPWPEESSAMKRGIPVVMKYAILAMICALAFFIRLFAVVRCRANTNAYCCVTFAGRGGGAGGSGEEVEADVLDWSNARLAVRVVLSCFVCGCFFLVVPLVHLPL